MSLEGLKHLKLIPPFRGMQDFPVFHKPWGFGKFPAGPERFSCCFPAALNTTRASSLQMMLQGSLIILTGLLS